MAGEAAIFYSQPLQQKIDKRLDPCRQMLVAGIDDMNWLEILRVPILQHRNKNAGIEVRLDMELAGPAKPDAGQARPGAAWRRWKPAGCR